MNDKITSKTRWWPALLLPLLVTSGCIPPTLPTFGTQTQQSPPVVVRSGSGNASALTALEQLIELKEELKKLRNAVEEMEFNAETAMRRQQNLFQDLDRRLLSLERAQRLLSGQSEVGSGAGVIPGLTPGLLPGGTVPGTVTDAAGNADVAVVGNAGATTPATPAQPGTVPSADGAVLTGAVSLPEQQAYEKSFNLLKQSKYQDAITGFQRLADTWPESQLADDAYYWMSEARYLNREFESALVGFRTVASRYPDSLRMPEALLKIGYIQYDIGEYKEAAEIFRDILARFPGHQVAVSAQTRLRRIQQTIQQ